VSFHWLFVHTKNFHWQDVIDNLENFKCAGAGDDTEYYVCRTLNYFLSEGDQLLTELREKHPQCLINME
jgi:hypothetical protein